MNNRSIGAQGYQGAGGSGSIGAQGAQGIQGSIGSQGSSGVQGNQGFNGVQGNQGFNGSQGLQGTLGAQGLNGTQGLQGSLGNQGNQGTQGPSFSPVSADVNMNSFSLTSLSNINGRVANSLVSGPASATVGRIPIFDNVNGKSVSDSGTLLSNLVPYTGATANLNLGSNNLINSGIIQTNSLTNYTGADFGSFGGNIVAGTTQTRAFDTKLTLQGTNLSDSNGPHITTYTASDAYPLTQFLNKAHDDITINFDCYRDGTGWKSSYATSNFQMWKNSNKLFTSCASGFTPGTGLSWTDSYAITSTGTFEHYKPVTQSDTTDGGLGVGSIRTAGGIYSAKRIYSADSISTTNVISSTPYCYWGYQQPIASISYTSGVAKLINLSAYTNVANPASVFTSNGVGMIIYSGPTLWFKIDILFSILPTNTSNSIYFGISKNSSTTLANQRVISFPTVSGLVPGYIPQNVTAIYQLANNNTVQLIGQYGSTGSITLFDSQITITCLS